MKKDYSKMAVLILLLTAICTESCYSQEKEFSLNVDGFGAVGDGCADDTAAIQAALDKAALEGGGIVRLPTGQYRIATHLRIPSNVTLEGVFTAPIAKVRDKGTVLLAEEGYGQEEGTSFIALGTNSTLKGLTVYYPKQDPKHIVPYPWCVTTEEVPAGGCVDNPSIVDVLLLNPYKAVDFAKPRSGRHYIRNLYGQPLRIGIIVDNCLDVGRIENVHFWPFWSVDPDVWKYTQANGEAFVFGRTDWQYCTNTFSWGYRIGYRFTDFGNGPCNGNFTGIGADATEVAVLVEQSAIYGLLITNGEFVSFTGKKPTQVLVKDSNIGVVQFNNCAFWGPAVNSASIAGRGEVSFNQCNFVNWDAKQQGAYAIECAGGSVAVSNSRFRLPHAVHLKPGVQTAIVSSNTFFGPDQKQIINDSQDVDVQIGLNVTRKTPRPVKSSWKTPMGNLNSLDQ